MRNILRRPGSRKINWTEYSFAALWVSPCFSSCCFFFFPAWVCFSWIFARAFCSLLNFFSFVRCVCFNPWTPSARIHLIRMRPYRFVAIVISFVVHELLFGDIDDICDHSIKKITIVRTQLTRDEKAKKKKWTVTNTTYQKRFLVLLQVTFQPYYSVKIEMVSWFVK